MASPMFELPEHFPIAVDENCQGPVDENSPEFDHFECWCSDSNCRGWYTTS